jgi:hypothetical protein
LVNFLFFAKFRSDIFACIIASKFNRISAAATIKALSLDSRLAFFSTRAAESARAPTSLSNFMSGAEEPSRITSWSADLISTSNLICLKIKQGQDHPDGLTRLSLDNQVYLLFLLIFYLLS